MNSTLFHLNIVSIWKKILKNVKIFLLNSQNCASSPLFFLVELPQIGPLVVSRLHVISTLRSDVETKMNDSLVIIYTHELSIFFWGIWNKNLAFYCMRCRKIGDKSLLTTIYMGVFFFHLGYNVQSPEQGLVKK